MTSSEQITILLADEDALRRDGLAAVLRGTPDFNVVAQCADGEEALARIRELRPAVAVVDLNLPKLHGIELVRRVRSEALGTRIVILSGSSDADIIREVVRAGADAYLLKNGPARHLVDAISYVRDGGQYFSPQLGRDGLDRRILEEPPRPREREPQETAGRDEGDYADSPRVPRDPRAQVSRRSAAIRGAGPERLRERIREDVHAGNLVERDYEILEMMAEGIRPILDRLQDIEGRIGDMESGEAPVPTNPRVWLDRQMADTFGDTRSGKEVAVSRSVMEIEARLPQMIEEAVTSRFQNMATRLQQEIEETHLRTLETFVKNIQVKLVQRVSVLETDMARQAEAMNQLREYSQRTEDNLSRLISGVDKLAQELPKRLAAPAEPVAPSFSAVPVAYEAKPVRRRASSGFNARSSNARGSNARTANTKIFWIAISVLAVIIVVGAFQLPKLLSHGTSSAPASGATAAAAVSGGAASPKVAPPPAGADTASRMKAAAQYADNKEYSLAENIYKEVLRAEPDNADARKALASVLYREDKIEESAAELEKLPRN